MVKEPAKPEREPAEADASPQEGDPKPSGSKTVALLRRLVSRKWLAIFLAISILGHGLGIAAFCLFRNRGTNELASNEISLGTYRFTPEQAEGSPILGAEFAVHVVLLDEIARSSRGLLAQHKFRVQAGIEELLRNVHGGDFRDVSLRDLKGRLQERVNEAVGMRAVAEVIVTDLVIERPSRPADTSTETAEATHLTDGQKPSS